MGDKLDEDRISKVLKKTGIGSLRRHIILCGGPNCCDEDDGDEAWDHLKERTGEAREAGGCAFWRTRVHCLHFCKSGPIGVVYPEGTWYHSLSPKNLDRVIEEHLQHGRVVEDLRILDAPLSAQDSEET